MAVIKNKSRTFPQGIDPLERIGEENSPIPAARSQGIRVKVRDKKFSAGFSVIEIIVLAAIVIIAFVAFFGLAAFSLRNLFLIKETTRANELAQEALEAVRNFRDGTTWDSNGIGALSAGVPYFIQLNSDVPPKWELILGQETIDIFNRQIFFSDVQRDANDDIVESEGTNDPDTRKITVIVSWEGKTVQVPTFLTNWQQ
ncbi:MAG: hypothetical protein G01um101430_11 [Parcubacteria group bacterium Gr01-1014_30]|nr:MAG: hypothetical protein G01um101430_11 [Parcubacteria group bacterium Gr01-1014_30]